MTRYVAFLHQPLGAAGKSALMAAKNKRNDFAALAREIYWLCLDKDDSIFLKSSLERVIDMPATLRNITSIRKLVEKHQ